MNIFTDHPHEQGVSYFEHWQFAMGIALRLLRSVVEFAVHAMLPAITIEKRFDLEATSAFLLERNRFIEAAATSAAVAAREPRRMVRRHRGVRRQPRAA